eukprot:COSAG02_NODE_5889_length_3958_cov_1.680228_2_plen_60_part_00
MKGYDRSANSSSRRRGAGPQGALEYEGGALDYAVFEWFHDKPGLISVMHYKCCTPQSNG